MSKDFRQKYKNFSDYRFIDQFYSHFDDVETMTAYFHFEKSVGITLEKVSEYFWKKYRKNVVTPK